MKSLRQLCPRAVHLIHCWCVFRDWWLLKFGVVADTPELRHEWESFLAGQYQYPGSQG